MTSLSPVITTLILRHGGIVQTTLEEGLCALVDSFGLTVANVGQESTFFKGRGSIVDVTLVFEATSERLREWRVRTDVENLSKYHHITFSYSNRRTMSNSGTAFGSRGSWPLYSYKKGSM